MYPSNEYTYLNNEEAKKNDRSKLLPIGLPTLPLLKPIYNFTMKLQTLTMDNMC